MNDHELTSARETLFHDIESGKTSEPPVFEAVESTAFASPLPPASSSGWPVSATMPRQTHRPRTRRSLSHMWRGVIAAGALMASLTGLFVGLGTSPSAFAAQPVAATSSTGHPASVGEGSNARSGPAAGGSTGTVGSVSKSSFILATSAGQEVTVDEVSSTKYEKGTSTASKSAITKGERVLVLGTVSSTTIKATEVLVQTTTDGSGARPCGNGGPLPEGCAGNVKAGRSDSCQL